MTTLGLEYLKYQELQRNNKAQVQLGYDQLAETTRHNKATEGLQGAQISLGYAQLAETKRANDLNYEIRSGELKLGKDRLQYQYDAMYWNTLPNSVAFKEAYNNTFGKPDSLLEGVHYGVSTMYNTAKELIGTISGLRQWR